MSQDVPARASHVGLARATLGGLRTARGAAGRTLLATGAIALGVALGFAVALINHTAVAEFAAGLATLSGDADLTVQGGRTGFAEALYPTLSRDPAIAVASPVLQLDATLPGRDRTLPLVGLDVLRAAAVTPALVGVGEDRFDTLRPDAVFLSAAASAWLGVSRGGTIDVQSGLGLVTLRVAGSVPADPGAVVGVMDIAGLQDAFDRVGRLTRIDLRLRPGFDVAATSARLAGTLPPGIAAVAPAASLESTARLTRAYRVNLDVLALVALFTGALLVYSTQSLAVQRRQAPFALMRSLGLTRGSLVRMIVGEGAVLGIVGSGAGLLAGYAIAAVATRWFGVDLGAGFFRGRVPGVVMDAPAALLFGTAGIVAAMAGSYGPARAAAAMAPAAALKSGVPALSPGTHPALGIAAFALGVALIPLPPVRGLPLFGYASIALLLIGTLQGLPALATLLLGWVPAPRSPPAALALAQLRHTPAQVRLCLAAIVAAVSLMSAMTVMVASFRGSLDTWLGQVLPADLYVRAGGGGDTAFLAPDTRRAIAALEGVERAEFVRATALALEPDAPRVALLARDIDPGAPERRLPLVGAQVAARTGGAPPAWISESVADRRGWRTGQAIILPIEERMIPFTVAGIWRDYARQQGAIVIERTVYAAMTGDARVTDAALWLRAGASRDHVRRAVEALAGADRVELATPGELRELSLRIFDRTFAVTYALEAVAVLIGLSGLSSAFGAQVLARRREFGVLRHLGATKRQIGAMLAVEGLALAALGVLVGMLLGFVIALILVHVVNRQSFHWSMDLIVPFGPLAALAAALVGLATLTAWLAGRRAMTDDAVRAVKDDW